MRQKIIERSVHALTAMLLTTGIVMPVLGVMDPAFLSPEILLICALIIVAFEAASIHRIAAFSAAGGLSVAVIVWLLGAGGAQVISDFMIAVTLRSHGILTALPLMAESARLITACFLALLCCFASMRKLTCIPSVIICTGAVLLVWLTDRTDLIPWLLPAFAAVVTMILSSRYNETQAIRIIPWSAGIVAAAFLIAGNGAVFQPLKDKADEFRQMIMDRLFFVEARDVFSLYAVGFSPQGQNQLGGKPNPDKSTMMQVTTSQVTYLRGAIYDRYDGHAWQNTAGGKRFLWESDRTEEDRGILFNQDLPSDNIPNAQKPVQSVTVRMLNDSASTLFVPQRIRDIRTDGDMVPYFANSTEVFITRNLRPGDTYEVSAPMYLSTDSGMGQILEICSAMDDPQWDSMPDIYRQIPDHMGQSVYDIVQDITKGANTPYDKAMMIQNWLNRHYQYTLEVGEHPDNIDFVTSFLMDTKKGYCTYFASAMTMLSRMADLPARYVEGYLVEPDPTGEAMVTGLDAHAWTEIYFKGFGWLTFDATPRQRRSFETEGKDPPDDGNIPTPDPGTEAPEHTPEPDNEPDTDQEPTPSPVPPDHEPTSSPEPVDHDPTPTPEQQDSVESPVPPSREPPEETSEPPDGGAEAEPPEEPNTSFPWLPAVILAVLAVLAGRILVTSPAVRDRFADSEEKRVHIWMQEVYDLLAANRLSRRSDETPMGFARRVDREGFFSTTVGPVGECISLLRYSTAEPLETDTKLIRNTAAALRKETGRPAKGRYWLRRLFLSRRKREWTR